VQRQGFLKRIWQRFCNPPSWVALLVYGAFFTFFALTVIAIVGGAGKSAPAYIIYACTGLTLVYALFLTGQLLRALKQRLLAMADKHTFTRNLRRDYVFRTVVLGACSFFGNVAYTVFLCVMALYSGVFWYWVLAGYYVLLTSMRGGVLLENRKNERKFGGNPTRLQKEKLASYRSCGVTLLTSTSVLLLSVVLILIKGGAFRMPAWIVYVMGAFAVYRMATAARHMAKAKRCDDIIVRIVRNVNFATALVSVFILQTLIMQTFAVHHAVVWNALTGIGVCIGIVCVGLYMLSTAKRMLQNFHEKL